jgi:hypothetical protein
MTDKLWTIDRLVREVNQWNCHDVDGDCRHAYCGGLCSGKAEDHCQAERDDEQDEDADVPGCHPDTCGQAQLEAMLAVVEVLLSIPGARAAADETLRKWMEETDDGTK